MMKWWQWVLLVVATAIALYGISSRERDCYSRGGKMTTTVLGEFVCDR